MSLNAFPAFRILGTNFMIYVFFPWACGVHHDAF
jgi:hypothetical protein